MEYNGTAEHGYAALCRRYGIAPDLYDVKANWDSTLEYRENMHHIEDDIKKMAPAPPVKESAREIREQAKAFDREQFSRIQEEKQQFLNNLFNNATERQGAGTALLDEIRKFSPFCERMTLSTLLAVNQGANVINVSPAGYGKSRGTKELLEVLQLPYTEISGHKAPTDFFNELKSAKGLVLIDESATLLRDNEILNLLLSALWTHKITWRDEEAKVECTIIFNTNSLPKTPFMEALKDRCQVNQLRLSTDHIRDKLISDFDYQPNAEVWSRVRNNAFVKSELTGEEIQKVKETLRATAPKSVRDKGRLLSQARFCKSMFGTIDFVTLFVDIDAVSAILASGLPRDEKCKAIAEAEGVSLRTAQRWALDAMGKG